MDAKLGILALLEAKPSKAASRPTELLASDPDIRTFEILALK